MTIEKLRLDGKVAIVTGAGTGIGRAISLELAKAGADVAVAARRLGPLEQTAAEVRKLGRKSVVVFTDITNSEQVDNMVARTIEEFGRLDILVNNAGAELSLFNLPILEITNEQWHRGLEVDLTGAFYCCRAAGKHMIGRKKGKIINISSGSGMGASPYGVMYGVAKAGMIQLTRTLGIAWARKGVNVNCVVLGSRFLTAATEVLKMDPNLIPIGRFGEPEEVASLVAFLASGASDYMTGGTYVIDGGVMADGFAPVGYAPVIEFDD